MEPFEGSLLNRSVHALDLTIGPCMFEHSEAIFNILLSTDPIKDVLKGIAITDAVHKLDTIIGQYPMNGVGYSLNQITQELRG